MSELVTSLVQALAAAGCGFYGLYLWLFNKDPANAAIWILIAIEFRQDSLQSWLRHKLKSL